MADRVLLNTQRKQLHDILVVQEIDPAQAKWTNQTMGWTHDNVDTLEIGHCHFLFNPGSNGTLSVHFRPSPDGGASLGSVNLPWREVLDLFSVWSVRVKGELEQEDPWTQYSAYIPPERIGGSTDNSPYARQEAERVVNAISTFQEHVRQLPHYNEVSKQFDPQFERLATQAKRGAGRIDWSNQFVGMLISLCIALSLAPDEASRIWRFWLGLVGGLLLSR